MQEESHSVREKKVTGQCACVRVCVCVSEGKILSVLCVGAIRNKRISKKKKTGKLLEAYFWHWRWLPAGCFDVWPHKCACVCVLVGGFRWQWWHCAMCTIIHCTSAFQELHGTHGRPKQPQPKLCGAAVNKSHSFQCKSVWWCWGAYRDIVMLCSIPVQVGEPIIVRVFVSFWWQQSASTQDEQVMSIQCCLFPFFRR